MPRPESKPAIPVSVVGSFAAGNLRGLAGILLRLSQRPPLTLVKNEQPRCDLLPIEQRPK